MSDVIAGKPPGGSGPAASPPGVAARARRAGLIEAGTAAVTRALALHPQGCPAHESVKDAIAITWDATLRAGDERVSLRSEVNDAASA